MAALIFLPTAGEWSVRTQTSNVELTSFESSRQLSAELAQSKHDYNFDLSFSFLVRSRPIRYARILSTTSDSTNGLTFTIDEYGNNFLVFHKNDLNEYQLMFVSKPLPLFTWNKIKIRYTTNPFQLEVLLNQSKLPLNEARPEKQFDISQVKFVNDGLFLKFSEPQLFDGLVTESQLVIEKHQKIASYSFLKLFLCLILLMIVTPNLRHLFRRLVDLFKKNSLTQTTEP